MGKLTWEMTNVGNKGKTIGGHRESVGELDHKYITVRIIAVPYPTLPVSQRISTNGVLYILILDELHSKDR